MPICQKILDRYGGRLVVESQPGRGTKVRVILPHASREERMANKDLLIVDDEPLVCESLKEMLAMEGYRVDAVLNGQAALDKMQEDQYQLVLSDIQMPGLERHRTAEGIERPLPRHRIIFITGHGHIDGAVEAIKLGAYDYIIKPIDDLRLKLTIGHALEQKKLLASYRILEAAPQALDPG